MESPHLFLNRLAKLFLMPIGLLLLLVTAYTIWSTNAWLARAVEVPGVVTEMVRMRDAENTGYVFAPRVRFATTHGRTIEFQSGLRTNPPAYRTGQSVRVVYDPDEPGSAFIRGILSLWLMPIILGSIGCVLLFIGTVMIVMSRWAAQVFDRPTAPA